MDRQEQPHEAHETSSPLVPHIQHTLRRFLITFSNSRVHGARPIVHHTAEGCMSSEREIAIFTTHFYRKGFTGLADLREAFEQYGTYIIDWIDGD